MQKFNIQYFTTTSTKPNLLVKTNNQIGIHDEFVCGWFRSSSNPELIVMGFSHLRIKDGYKLRAYQYSDGGNGNGVVWAIPADKELPEPEKCEQLDGHFLDAPKPFFALNDFMLAIEGDQSPMSYLQASIVHNELDEFGAVWHGTSWGQDIILPMNDIQRSNINYYEWDMIEDEPELIDPHFYYNSEGNPIVVFHTINDVGIVTMNRYVHTFSKDYYTMQVEQTCIATAGVGIIF